MQGDETVVTFLLIKTFESEKKKQERDRILILPYTLIDRERSSWCVNLSNGRAHNGMAVKPMNWTKREND
ncbi:Uncharacterized protein APZ42_018697 [Daphnia magna]|uniref:Uncharacterized protein n=1 Tax=Daphnia magna TaxID=35525 RepID=A0A164YRL8_9CRUS|nr:Uncharacterized protein APZ42_018697 [Daphnia magna]